MTNLTACASQPLLYSELGADPDLGELVAMFVDEMPARIDALASLAAARNWVELSRAAHQLKGSSGSYGFQQLTPAAARLEAALGAGEPEDQVLLALQELVELCRLARAGAPQ